MEFLLKFKGFDKNEHSINDVVNCTASFGLYKLYKNQGELEGEIDYMYLNKKYGDNSLTKDNATSFIKQYVEEKYAVFCMAGFEPMNKKRLKVLWENYTNNNGFVILYSFDDVHSFYLNHAWTGLFYFNQVEYLNHEYKLTNFFDCFLDAYKNIDDEDLAFLKLQSLLKERQCDKDVIKFMSSKTKYKHSIENEYRFIKQTVLNETNKEGYTSIEFVKPLKIFILKNSDFVQTVKLINICESLRIPFVFVKENDLLKL